MYMMRMISSGAGPLEYLMTCPGAPVAPAGNAPDYGHEGGSIINTLIGRLVCAEKLVDFAKNSEFLGSFENRTQGESGIFCLSANNNRNKHMKSGGLPPYIARRIECYIAENLDKDIRVSDMSLIAKRSLSQFSRNFRDEFGTSPHNYILKRRIRRAQELLIITKEPISIIAILCGFSDQSHFTRSFKKRINVTPREWRNGKSRFDKFICLTSSKSMM